MPNSRLTGMSLIAVGLALFAVLVYEPANIVAALGVGDVMDEASVALACLAFVAACLLTGAVSLRPRKMRRLAESDHPGQSG